MAKIILLTRVVRVSLSRSLNNLLLGCFLLSAIDLVAVETSSKQRGSITREEEGKRGGALQTCEPSMSRSVYEIFSKIFQGSTFSANKSVRSSN